MAQCACLLSLPKKWPAKYDSRMGEWAGLANAELTRYSKSVRKTMSPYMPPAAYRLRLVEYKILFLVGYVLKRGV